jgi:hypothetical protein
MGVTTFNGSNRTITDVRVALASGSGDILQKWTYDEIPPGVTMAEIRQAQEGDWAKRPSRRTFEGTVTAHFQDADGKRWHRDSEGKIRIMGGRRATPRMT